MSRKHTSVKITFVGEIGKFGHGKIRTDHGDSVIAVRTMNASGFEADAFTDGRTAIVDYTESDRSGRGPNVDKIHSIAGTLGGEPIMASRLTMIKALPPKKSKPKQPPLNRQLKTGEGAVGKLISLGRYTGTLKVVGRGNVRNYTFRCEDVPTELAITPASIDTFFDFEVGEHICRGQKRQHAVLIRISESKAA